MKKEDLIVLMYASNTTCAKVVGIDEVEEKSFRINLRKKIWSYMEWKNIPIGESRSQYDLHSNIRDSGVIGVYDRTNIRHLDAMVHDGKEMTSLHGPAIYID